MGLVPKKVKADNKLGFGDMTFNVFLGLLMTVMVAMLIGNAVHSSIRILFQILCAGLFLLLSLPSRSHPKQRIYQSILSFLKYQFSVKRYDSIITQHFEEAKEVLAVERKAGKDLQDEKAEDPAA